MSFDEGATLFSRLPVVLRACQPEVNQMIVVLKQSAGCGGKRARPVRGQARQATAGLDHSNSRPLTRRSSQGSSGAPDNGRQRDCRKCGRWAIRVTGKYAEQSLAKNI